MRHSNDLELSIYANSISACLSFGSIKFTLPLALALADKLFNVGDDI